MASGDSRAAGTQHESACKEGLTAGHQDSPPSSTAEKLPRRRMSKAGSGTMWHTRFPANMQVNGAYLLPGQQRSCRRGEC